MEETIMRLFTAILFNDEVKDKLEKIKNTVRAYAIKGNFTLKNNLHLTLVFLGEVEQCDVDSIVKALDKVEYNKFDMTLNRLGKFSRRDGDILWLGMDKENSDLARLRKLVYRELGKLGFHQDKFTPHITLGRRVVLKEDLDSIQTNEISTRVDRISLMLSERVDNVLTYTEIYSKNLH
jgi:2'-5' RNA ligase